MSAADDHDLYVVGKVLEAYSPENLNEVYAGWVQARVRNLSLAALARNPSYTLNTFRALTSAYAARREELDDQRKQVHQARLDYIDGFRR